MWEEFELSPKEFFHAGDKVAVLLEERGRTRNGLETSREIAHLARRIGDALVGANGSISPQELDCGVFRYQVATDSGRLACGQGW